MGSIAWLLALGVAEAAVAPVAPELRAVLPALKQRARVAILLPSILPYDRVPGHKLHVAATASASRWSVSLFYGRTCGANACSVGFLDGQRGAKVSRFPQRVTLARGVRGTYKPTTCGASCSPPELDWVLRGATYRIQLQVPASKARERALIVKTANSAITAGPR